MFSRGVIESVCVSEGEIFVRGALERTSGCDFVQGIISLYGAGLQERQRVTIVLEPGLE